MLLLLLFFLVFFFFFFFCILYIFSLSGLWGSDYVCNQWEWEGSKGSLYVYLKLEQPAFTGWGLDPLCWLSREHLPIIKFKSIIWVPRLLSIKCDILVGSILWLYPEPGIVNYLCSHHRGNMAFFQGKHFLAQKQNKMHAHTRACARRHTQREIIIFQMHFSTFKFS